MKFNDIGGGSMFDNAYSVWSGVKRLTKPGKMSVSSDLWQSKEISEVAPSWKARIELYDMGEQIVFKGVARFRTEADAEKFLEEVYKVVEYPSTVVVESSPKPKSKKPTRKVKRGSSNSSPTLMRGLR